MSPPETSHDEFNPAITNWVSQSLRQKHLLYVAGSVCCLLLGVVTLWLTWWILYMVLGFLLLSFSISLMSLSLMTWGSIALLFVCYATANWTHLEKFEMESIGRLRMARAAAYVSGSSFLALTGPKTASSFVKVVSLTLLLGPGLLATSWQLLQKVRGSWVASPDNIGRFLIELAKTTSRVPFDRLRQLDGSDLFPANIHGVLLFEGVLFKSSEPVGLMMTDSLRHHVRGLAKRRKDKPRQEKIEQE